MEAANDIYFVNQCQFPENNDSPKRDGKDKSGFAGDSGGESDDTEAENAIKARKAKRKRQKNDQVKHNINVVNTYVCYLTNSFLSPFLL